MEGALFGANMGSMVGGVAANFTVACFTAGTHLKTPHGSKPIEQFKPGDEVTTRDEYNSDAAVVTSHVEEVFVREAFLLDLHIGGKVIQTTAEHPFYVRNFGWLPAGELKASDELSTSDGSWVKVDAIHSTGKWSTVYNLRVAQHHTYFVGENDWGFDVWAHNASYKVSKSVRSSAVTAAWEQEAELVRRTGRGTHQWTDAQKAELLSRGKVRRYQGHHISSVSGSPLFAGLSDNIEFVTRYQHFKTHEFNWRTQTYGNLLDRGQ